MHNGVCLCVSVCVNDLQLLIQKLNIKFDRLAYHVIFIVTSMFDNNNWLALAIPIIINYNDNLYHTFTML